MLWGEHSVIAVPISVHCVWGRVPIVIIPLLLLLFSMRSLYSFLCKSCSLSPQFFRRNCCTCRCRFCMSIGRGEFMVFLLIPSWTALPVSSGGSCGKSWSLLGGVFPSFCEKLFQLAKHYWKYWYIRSACCGSSSVSWLTTPGTHILDLGNWYTELTSTYAITPGCMK